MALSFRRGRISDVDELIRGGCPPPQNRDDLDAEAAVLLAWEDDRPVGYAVVTRRLHGQPLRPGELFMHVAVAPEQRRRGIGSKLYRRIMLRVGVEGDRLDASVAPGDQASLSFAEARGFRFDYEICEAVLDLHRFDSAPFRAELDAAAAKGARFVTLAEIADPAETVRAVYELDRETSYDIPQWAGHMPPFDDYAAELLAAPDGVALAFVGEELAGMAVTVAEADGAAYASYLGVRRAHRGRGIALGLKLRSIEWAKAEGLSRLRTHNNAASAPIVSLNRKLGCAIRSDSIYLVSEW